MLVSEIKRNIIVETLCGRFDGDLDEFMAAPLAARVGEGGDKEAAQGAGGCLTRRSLGAKCNVA